MGLDGVYRTGKPTEVGIAAAERELGLIEERICAGERRG